MTYCMNVVSRYFAAMAKFETHILSVQDGSWDNFKRDWAEQAEKAPFSFDEYVPTSMALMTEIVEGTGASLGPLNMTRVAALWDADTSHYYACSILNRTGIPGWSGRVLRVRELTVSPLIDLGEADVAMYPDVIIGIFNGIVHLSSTALGAEHIHMHLRSPGDQAFFHVFGTDLGASNVFASVQARGTWLYITKSAGVGTSAGVETKQ